MIIIEVTSKFKEEETLNSMKVKKKTSQEISPNSLPIIVKVKGIMQMSLISPKKKDPRRIN